MTAGAGAPPRAPLDAGSGSFGRAALRTRIAALLADPAVAARVGRRLARRAPAASAPAAGTPVCLRVVLPVGEPRAPILVRAGLCAGACGAVDCLCGRYPARLDPPDPRPARLERLAV